MCLIIVNSYKVSYFRYKYINVSKIGYFGHLKNSNLNFLGRNIVHLLLRTKTVYILRNSLSLV